MVAFNDYLTKQLAEDPAFREEWAQTSPARELSLLILKYRNSQDMSQGELAHLLGMKPPQVSRLESAEVMPTFPTIRKLCQALGMHLSIEVDPTGLVTIKDNR